MCDVPNCNEENCVHKKVRDLKEQVSQKLDLAEKHRYKWKGNKVAINSQVTGTHPAKILASGRGR